MPLAHKSTKPTPAQRRPFTRRSAIAASALLALGLQAFTAQAATTTILFIGNSFTYGALASVQNFRTSTVTDLNGTNIGGVPALFKAFTQQTGLDYTVSLETQPGSNLDFHLANRLALIDKPWDKVVMHGQSNLDFAAPNNPTKISVNTGLLGAVFQARNPNVDIGLTATWSRADLTYLTASPWLGKPITSMAIDIQAGYDVAAANNPSVVDFVSPVGLAWNRAIQAGFADANPYDGIDAGKVNLWASDAYHASNYGYYLHALTVFGKVTGIDPRTLGANESAAAELGFTASQTANLQRYAFEQINNVIPEPGSWALVALALGLMGVVSKQRRQPEAAAAV